MIEEFGNFWEVQGDARCITTNGALRTNGDAVMGKGIALQAKERYPRIEATLGRLIQKYGNHVYYLGHGLISFPTKHHWMDEKSDINLIKRSAVELVALLRGDVPIKSKFNRRILLTRPGCGNGNLEWRNVRPMVQAILSSNEFIIVHNNDDREEAFKLKEGILNV
jgi:hypothetical protein